MGCDKEFLLRVSQTYDKMLVASVLSGHTFAYMEGLTEPIVSILLKP